MGRKYNIAQRIAEANQKPTIIVDNNHEFEMNTGKSVVIIVMALAEEIENSPESESIKLMDKMIALVFKKSEAEYIQSLDLTFAAYQLLIETIMAAFGNKELEEIEKEVEKTTKKKSKTSGTTSSKTGT